MSNHVGCDVIQQGTQVVGRTTKTQELTAMNYVSIYEVRVGELLLMELLGLLTRRP